MFRALKRRLALLYTLMAGVVLLLVTLFCLRAAESQLRYAAQTAFEGSVNTVLYKLQSDRTLSQTWLSQVESGERQIVYVEDEGVPLSFRGAWSPDTPRETLIERALSVAEASGLSLPLGSLRPTTQYFELDGTVGDRYHACVTLLPGSGHTPLRVVMLRDQSGANARIDRQRLWVLAITLVGLLALAIGGWLYSGHAIRPAAQSHARQVEFTAMAAHELKAPLAALSAGVDALATLDAAPRDLLKTLSGEALRMARLVDDLLLLSRSDAGTWSLRPESIDLDTLLIECYELFCPLAAAKRQKLALELPDEPLPLLSGDAERIKQLFAILLSNAVCYASEGGRIALRAATSGKCVRFEVEDDGPGIDPALKEKIFERFYRADAAHQDREHAGLGLSIARELSQLHGGKISMENVAPHGARFVVLLPRNSPTATRRAPKNTDRKTWAALLKREPHARRK